MSIHFYDSASPESIPSGVYAAVYINGRFAWPESEIKRMSKVFRITVEPGAQWAKEARCIDIENGDATPEDAMSFLIERHKLYGDATAYCDRSTLPTVEALVKQAKIEVFYWIATLDGTQNIPGAWAVQYQGGIHAAFDLSVLHGVNNFHKP
jgi:hypothetical protein